MHLASAWMWIAIGMVGGACGNVANGGANDARPSDGSPPDAKPPRCNPTAAFGTPVAVTALNTSSNDEAARLSSNELTVYSSSDRGGGVGSWDIWLATRASTSDAFGTPSLLAGVNTTGLERYPTVTADGLVLYAFVGADPNYDLAIATRASVTSSFSALSTIAALNTSGSDELPYALPDGSAIYFESQRSNSAELYRAVRNGAGFDAPNLVTGTNLEVANQSGPVLSPDELTLYFNSDRAGSGTYEIYEATRASTVQGFDAPVALNLDPTGKHFTTPSWISNDNCVLYFTSRSVSGDYDIYYARRGN